METRSSRSALPECVWDAQSGVLVLYWGHEEDPEGDVLPGFQLVVERDGRAPAYVGEMPPGRRVWAVRAPFDGAFRLRLHPQGPVAALNAPPVAVIPFDFGTRPNPQQPVGTFQRLSVWLIPALDNPRGQPDDRPEPRRIEIEPRRFLVHALEEEGWEPGSHDGLVVTRITGEGPSSTRGPAVRPACASEQTIKVYFALDEDEPVGDDVIQVAGFERLKHPAIYVDLTSFGDDAEVVAEAFSFVHRPHGLDAKPSYYRGADCQVLVSEIEGRIYRYLHWPCVDGCHLDLMGVHCNATADLRLMPTNELRLDGANGDEPVRTLVGLFYGDGFQMQPQNPRVSEYMGRVAGQETGDSLAIRRNTAFAYLSGRWGELDLRGAEHIGAFTVLAYADWLGRVLGDGTSSDPDPASLLRGHGLSFQSLWSFVRSPDLAMALVGDMDLLSLLREGRLSLTEGPPPGALCPSTALAAAMEPGNSELIAWVEGLDGAAQRALWLFMRAGGAPSDWKALGLVPKDVSGDAKRLVARIAQAKRERPVFLDYVATDLGFDPAPLRRPLTSLEDAIQKLGLLRVLERGVMAELETVNRALLGGLDSALLEPDSLAANFTKAIDSGEELEREHLRRQVLGLAASLGEAAKDLVPVLLDVRTRIVLLGLATALGPLTGAQPQSRESSRGTNAIRPKTVASVPERDTASASQVQPDAPKRPVAASAQEARSTNMHRGSPTGAAPSPLADEQSRSAQDGLPFSAPDSREVDGPKIVPDTPNQPSDTACADPTRPLRWMSALLDKGSIVYPSVDQGNAGGPDLIDLLREVEGQIVDRLDFWDDGELDVPQWGAHLEREREAIAMEFDNSLDRSRSEIQHVASHLANYDVDIGQIAHALDRIEALREFLVAERVWDLVVARAEAALNGGASPELQALAIRMGQSGPEKWPGLASQLERLTQEPLGQ